MLLIQDENPDVRYSMAENHKLPSEALEILAKDDNPFVKFRAEKTLARIGEEV
jgi:HEAT repeat protein